jgi:hypothetical protein
MLPIIELPGMKGNMRQDWGFSFLEFLPIIETMKRKMFSIPAGTAALAVCALIFFAACGEISNDYDSFSYDLRGTWVNLDSTYTDTVEITIDTIKITPDPFWGPPVPGLAGFTAYTALEGYSEKQEDNSSYGHKGNLFINDMGDWRTPIPYSLWNSYSDKRLTIGDNSNPLATNKFTTFKKQ